MCVCDMYMCVMFVCVCVCVMFVCLTDGCSCFPHGEIIQIYFSVLSPSFRTQQLLRSGAQQTEIGGGVVKSLLKRELLCNKRAAKKSFIDLILVFILFLID